MGKEQFKGVQIYDVIQDHDLNYWFATNEGLYVYDFYKYEKIDCDADKGNSVFGFQINKDGTIYCHNLNNQIFEIKNKQCNLFYEIPIEYGRPDITISVTDDNNLIICSKTIQVLNKLGKVIQQFNTHGNYIGSSFKTKKNELIFHTAGEDSIISYLNGTIVKKRLSGISHSNLSTEYNFQFFKLKNKSLVLELKSKNLYLFDESNYSLKNINKNTLFSRSLSVKIYETEHEIWLGSTLRGIVLFENNITSTNGDIQFQDYFISDVYKDIEGNYLLSTFDKGIIVIPDLKVPDVINSFKEDPISTLTTDHDLGILLGSSKGSILSYNNSELKSISSIGFRPITGCYNDSTSEWLLYDDGIIKAYNKKNNKTFRLKTGSLKDAAFASKNTIYLGTNSGIRKTTWNANKFKETELEDFQFRIYSLEYNPNNKSIYASTANGLYEMDSLEKGHLIRHRNQPIFPNSIYQYNSNTYASIKKKGILIIKDTVVVDSIILKVNQKPIQINKLIIFKNTLLVKSLNNLYQFTMNGELLNSIHSVFGFSDNRIIDFTIHENQLWVSHSEGVQKIDLNYKPKPSNYNQLKFKKILINNRQILLSEVGNFGFQERKFQVELSLPTLLNHETISYHYKLEGFDADWNINNFEFNIITYNALPPGSYTFIAKSENKGIFSTPILYSFTIEKPYYEKWWFITTLILVFLIIVILIYRYQLKLQQKKSKQLNELNSSKLIAIQSQMNPHFIFNSLNSIQDLVLKGDIEKSYSYITTFSNLVRRTLSYSEKDFIDFEQEIKLLEIYLSLEKLRFKKDFTYEINYDETEDFMLPPLLIQPFIENSLIHGLLHKDGLKKLSINFCITGKSLICTIIDNGIGREKSKAIKIRQKNEHESFSGKAIKNRFDILSNVFKGDYGYFYEDLYENEIVSGTKVTLTIPIKYKF
jgi:hypothetical protein